MIDLSINLRSTTKKTVTILLFIWLIVWATSPIWITILALSESIWVTILTLLESL